MVKKPLKSRFKLNLNTFSVAFLVIAFTVLAVFMVQSPMTPRGSSVDLPRVERPVSMWKALREDALIVAVQKDGTIFFNDDKVAADQLTRGIRERVSKGAERKVYVKADARAKVGAVNEVLDGIRAAGIENVAFLVEQRKPVTALPATALSH